jgi:hypothetical protein
VPFTLNTGAVFAIDNGFPHFTADVDATNGTFDVGEGGGVAFGFFGEEHSFTVDVGGDDLRTASFAGVNSAIVFVGELRASTEIKAGDNVIVDATEGAVAGALQLQSTARINGAVTVSGSATPSFGTVVGSITFAGPSVVEVGTVLEAATVVVDQGLLTLGGTINATNVIVGSQVTFASASATVSTATFELEGTLNLAGQGTLQLTGVDTVFTVRAGGTITSAAPNNHRIVVDNALGASTSFSLPGEVVLDDLVVGAQSLTCNGTLVVDTLDLALGASIVGSVIPNSCGGAGAAGCP